MKFRGGRRFRGSGVLAAIGDSHTFNFSYLSMPLFWPNLVAKALGMRALNLGSSGHSTAQAYSRRALANQLGIPQIAVVYAGTNDINAMQATVAASPAPTSSVFSLTDDEEYHAADGFITVAGEAAQVASVSGVQLTLTAALAGGAPAAGAAVLVATQRNLEALVGYWKRLGVPHVFVVGQHYLNFSASGDTTSVQVSWASDLRTIQQAAAVAAGAKYVDVYAYMRGLILAGEVAQGDASWHVADLDTHLGATGEAALARAILSKITQTI